MAARFDSRFEICPSLVAARAAAVCVCDMCLCVCDISCLRGTSGHIR